MLPYNLNIQSKAQKDVERIYDYIRYTLLNTKAAEDFIDCLEYRYGKIADNPHGFSTEWIHGRLYRKSTVKRYVVIFRIEEITHTVYIIAIGHGSRKRKNILK